MDKDQVKVQRMESDLKDLTKDVIALKETSKGILKAQHESNEEQKETNKALNGVAKQLAELIPEMRSNQKESLRAHDRIDDVEKSVKELATKMETKFDATNKDVVKIDNWRASVEGMLKFVKVTWPLLAIGLVITSMITISKIT